MTPRRRIMLWIGRVTFGGFFAFTFAAAGFFVWYWFDDTE